MKTKTVLFIFIFFASFSLLSKNSSPTTDPGKNFIPLKKAIINNLDTIVFDLANATITATYIDIPIYIISDDVIVGIDYAMQFNLTELTYSTTVDLVPNDPTIVSLAYFNPSDLYLRYTSTTLQTYPGTGNIHMTKIRFALNAPCPTISTSDFTNLLGILNGDQCAVRMTNLNFTQYIPTANFNTGPTCSNATVQFSNTSTVTNGNITGSQWTFSNGGTSTQLNPSTSFTATGAASATLITTTGIGCKDTIIQSLNINAPPVSGFTYSFDCVKDSVLFTNTSTIPSGSITGSAWNFGDQSGTSSDTNPVYHYNSSGFFTASLISTSGFSCTSTSTLVLDLSNKVVASFSSASTSSCLGATFNFTDASTYALGPITSWLWNFGDGNTSTQQNTSHTFTSSGTFSITLTSGSADGCKGTLTRVLNISPPPVVAFTVDGTTGCANAAISFTDLSVTAANSTYLWHFGDNTNSTLQHPTHSYTTSGSYSVKLVVTTPGGCSDSLTKTSYLTINNSPVGSFSLSSACILTNILFTNYMTIATGSIVTWSWNLGDGTTSTIKDALSSYSVAGNYSVTLTATSDLGCVGTTSQVIELSQKPVVNFSSTSGLDCSGETLSFTNLSTPLNGPSYIWRFGDGTSSVLQNPVHTYMTSGFYAIKLVVINPGGCADSLVKPYNSSVPTRVEALFSETILANATVSFTNTSANSTKVKWDFGDNQTSTLDHPIHAFPQIETYKVCLTAYNSLNCTDTTCKNLFTGVYKIVAIPSSFTPNDDNVNDVLRVRGGPFSEIRFQIFNEWGNLIFSSDTQEQGWDGSFNGEAQPVGTYEYVLKAQTLENKKINLYGVVNLTR